MEIGGSIQWAVVLFVFFCLLNRGENAMAVGKKSGIEPVYLRCEYKVNPLGIDNKKPRLSWEILSKDSKRRSQKQTTYQIQVATSKSLLVKGQPDLWDSGVVKSGETNQIVYRGRALKSHRECWWRVRISDENESMSVWSSPAYWSIGLLSAADWKAQWIGYDEPVPKPDVHAGLESQLSLSHCRWVWFPEGNPPEKAPAGSRFFRGRLSIASSAKVLSASFLLTADDQFKLYVNGHQAGQSDGKRDAWKRPQTIEITSLLQPSVNTVAIEATNTSDSPAGLTGVAVVLLSSGESLSLKVNNEWKCSKVLEPEWNQAGFDDSRWVNAADLGDMGRPPWGVPGQSEGLHLPPPPYLRKEFAVRKSVKRAVAYASALGVYELRINGAKVGNDFFTPGWTDYKKRVYYNTYDVTQMLSKGDNALGIILADGWYSGHVGWGLIRDRYGDKPRAGCHLRIEYKDGTTETFLTDAAWKASYGPILEADFLMGETYHAGREIQGWDKSGFDDSSWSSVVVVGFTGAKIESYPGVPVQHTDTIKAKSVDEVQPGVFVFDLGQNMVGWVRLKFKGSAGQRVQLRFAEMLNPDGTLYTTNLRGARSIDTYYCKGRGIEKWEPRFTFHGFRYVEIQGLTDKPGLDTITGIVVHSNAPATGSFSCSNPMVNQLYHNIVWGQKGNYLEVPTDCPQRDERLGWTGDAQVFVRTASYNMDIASFFTKWIVDVCDAQRDDGAFTDIAPDLGLGAGVPAWGDAGIVCPQVIHQVYGDKRMLERHYESMARHIEYLKANSDGLLRPAHGYGDWLSINADTPKDVIATAYFAYVVRLMADVAGHLGKPEDVTRFNELFREIREAFIGAYVKDDGSVKGNTQTSYCLALFMDLLPESIKPLTVDLLVKDIESREGHLSTGFVGLPILLKTLTQFGRKDVAYKLLLNDTFPSWGYEIKHGATTIWERWDGWTHEKGFQDPGMNSFNHYAFGAVGEWLFATVAGIDTEEPGFKKILIRPCPDDRIPSVRAKYRSINGEIVSDWSKSANKFTMTVVIPVNTEAVAHIPAVCVSKVRESGSSLEKADGIRSVEMTDGYAVVRVGSGRYRFVSTLD